MCFGLVSGHVWCCYVFVFSALSNLGCVWFGEYSQSATSREKGTTVERSTAAAGGRQGSGGGQIRLEQEVPATMGEQRGFWRARVVLATGNGPGTGGSSDGYRLQAIM